MKIKERQKARDIMENLMHEYYELTFNTEGILRSYIIILFSNLLRDEAFETNIPIKKNSNGKAVSVIEFLRYIEEHFNSCTLKSMADYFGFNSSYLSNLLKKNREKF